MNQYSEITGLLKGAIPFSNKTLSVLSDLTMQYPYFQIARLLYTLNLLSVKDSNFLYELRKTSIYLQDRKQLFFKIEDEFFTPEIIKALETDNELSSIDPSFEKIDFFLSGEKKEKEATSIETEYSPVNFDYSAYYLSDIEGDEEAPPFQYQDTIDRFLEKDAISPVKIRIDKREESEEEKQTEQIPEQANSEIFFSEQLAKIYIKKKKYNKALEIMRKINLQYPEKNRYFADQIRFLEKLIINTNNKK